MARRTRSPAEEDTRRSPSRGGARRRSAREEADPTPSEQPRRPPPQRDLEAFGYSSSSESDEAPRKSTNGGGGGGNQNQKKKKKPKPPPQKSINKIWRRFASKEPTKALSVLPFDPVPLPTTPERPNELLSDGYERVREECARRVHKIIKECRRVNTRYRDPGFDLDWDLKWMKGNTLNYLGSNKFDITGPRLSTSTAVPKAVKRVHQIFDKPTFRTDLSGSDVKQGALGNCWFVASLSALANVDKSLERCCVAYDTRIGIYGFVFYRDGEWIYSIVDDKLFLTSPCWDSPSLQRDLLNQIDRDHPEREYRRTYQTGSKALFFGQCKDQSETFVPLVEKAYAKAHGDYGSLAGGWIGEGLEDLTGGVTTELLASDILDLDGFWDDELSKVNQEFLFGCSTGLLDGGYGERNGIREGHAYVVMDARTLKSGERLVKLRNPWGKTRKGIWEGAWSDGSKEWTREVQEELGHEFGNDSVFWITYDDLLEKYLHFDRTRLFRDPDWRCCQRWIGVEVPWKPQWNEKFRLAVSRDATPLVLTLQQLDDRYYKGLHGQYTFRVHFRLHEVGRPGAEDYIVRSHGNYLMSRSISIELPEVDRGEYAVFISVAAERDTRFPSVEEVVRRECRDRVENDKLAQVGRAYDLAHSKGVAHLEHVARLRKRSDRDKASGSRMAERRKLWEKRHANREVNRKQQQKNKDKRQRRRDAFDAEQKAKRAEEEEEEKKKKAAEEAAEKEKEKEKTETKKAEDTEKEKAEAEKPKDVGVQTVRDAGEDKSVQTGSGEKPAAEADETESKDASQEEKKEDSSAASDTKKDASAADSAKDDKTAGNTEADQTAAAAPAKKEAPAPAPAPLPAYDSDNDSSDSPVEEWELMYSSDDMSRKPRMAAPPPPAANANEAVESDGESAMPEPWNAVCILGFRVYSKDPDLQLRTVVEGGDMAEHGMGPKGPANIDDAQANAGGGRREDGSVGGGGGGGGKPDGDEVELIDGAAVVETKKQQQQEKQQKKADGGGGGESRDPEMVVVKDDAQNGDEADDEDEDEADNSRGNNNNNQEKNQPPPAEGGGKDDSAAAKSDEASGSSSDSTPVMTPDSSVDGANPDSCTPQGAPHSKPAGS